MALSVGIYDDMKVQATAASQLMRIHGLLNLYLYLQCIVTALGKSVPLSPARGQGTDGEKAAWSSHVEARAPTIDKQREGTKRTESTGKKEADGLGRRHS